MDHQFKKAAIYSISAYFMLALGIVAWKTVIAGYNLSQVLALEAVISLPLFIGLAKIKGGIHLLKTSYPALQVTRGILQTCSAYSGLYGLVHLSASTYTMLYYCTPFIVSFSAWLFLKEKCPPVGWFCIAIGFVGTALIIQPEYTDNLIAALAIILSCCFWAANVILMKKMPKDHVISFSFYTLIIVGFISFVIVMMDGITPMTLFDFSMISIAGVLFFIGAQILFASYRMAPLYYLTPFQYTEIVWIIALSYILWADTPSFIQMMGLMIIILAATYSSFLQKEEQS